MFQIVVHDKLGRRTVRAFDQDLVVIGRDEGNDVVLDDASVSKRHARLERRGDELWIVDDGSTNGVFLDGIQATAPRRVVDGDRVGIGEFTLMVGTLDEAVADSYRIAITRPDGNVSTFTLQGAEATLGKASGCDLVLDGDGVSDRHLRVVVKADRIVLADLRSDSGTWVNGDRLSSPHVVREGDTARAGCFTMSFAHPGEPGPLPAAPVIGVGEDVTVPTAEPGDHTPAGSRAPEPSRDD
jgi:pSer/pThr/pTyr-binding forkhead associated (FHA) protein